MVLFTMSEVGSEITDLVLLGPQMISSPLRYHGPSWGRSGEIEVRSWGLSVLSNP